MKAILKALKRYRLKNVELFGKKCPGGNPYKPVNDVI